MQQRHDRVRVNNVTGDLEIDTGDGNDKIIIKDHDTSADGDITVQAGDGNDKLKIDGVTGDINVDMGDGNDKVFIDNVTGDIYIDSGDGNDRIRVDSVTGDVEILAGEGNDTVYVSDVEGDVSIDGGAGNDNITVTNVDGHVYIDAGSGNDRVIVRGVTMSSTIIGGTGNDLLIGGNQADEIYGNEGNDALFGKGGDDMLYGGGGHDTLLGGNGHDELYGGEGHDFLLGGSGNDDMHGDAGDDLLIGWSGDDTLEGGMGNDFLDGGYGNDTAVFSGLASEYIITNLGWGFVQVEDTVAGRDGVDILRSIENFVFEGVPNQAPIAVDDAILTDENNATSEGALTGLLSNDSDPDGDPLLITKVNGSSGNLGTQITLAGGLLLTLNADGSYTLDPDGQFEYLAAGEIFQTSFTYTVSDGDLSSMATVDVTITGVNDAAVIAGDLTGSVTEDAAPNTVSGVATAMDVDNADNLFQMVASGAVSDNAYGTYEVMSDGTWVYTLDNSNPLVDALNNGDMLMDSFQIASEDGTLETVTITINGSTDLSALFTDNNDTVDFNSVLAGTYIDGTQYDALAGDDVVILPDIANAAAAGFVIGTLFDGGEGDDTITGGDGNDLINGSFGSNTLNGMGGDDTFVLDNLFLNDDTNSSVRKVIDVIDGGTGNDTLDASTLTSLFDVSGNTIRACLQFALMH